MRLDNIKSTTKEYLRNELIFKENDDCNYIAIIKRGNIKKINSITKNIEILNQNDYIGLDIIFSSNKKYKDSYISESLTTLLLISLDELLLEMYKNIDVFQDILRYLSDTNLRLNEHINILRYKTVKEKLCYFLYQEHLRVQANTFIINYTKNELAIFLNVERHLLSNEIINLINENIIANQNKLYTIIDINKLVKYI